MDGAESDDSYHDLKKAAKDGSLTFQQYRAIKNRRKNASKRAYTKDEVAKLDKPNYEGITAKVWTNNEEFYRAKRDRLQREANIRHDIRIRAGDFQGV